MVLSRILIATLYNDSKTVRRPAPRDHPPAFSRHRLPLAPETCTTFTRGCMSSGPRSTRSQRLPRACSDFIRGSGLVGRTVWKVMMAHLKYELRSRPVRAMWDEFDAIVAGHSGRESYFSTTGESCSLNLFDIQLVRSTGNVVHPSLGTTSSTRRRYESNYHDHRR